MRLKKVTKLKKLSKSEADRLSDAYINEEYVTEIIPTKIHNDILKCENEFELHVYKIIKRGYRWYTKDWR